MTLENLQRLCTLRGISIARAGCGYRLTGPGVSLLIADLRQITDFDLEPAPLGNHAFTRPKDAVDVLGRNTGG